jgi:hypothetical protein
LIELSPASQYFLCTRIPQPEVPVPNSAVDAIDPAIKHAKQQILDPFHFGQWARLAFVGLLAGEMGSSGCNGNFNIPSSMRSHTHSDTSQAFLANPWTDQFLNHPVLSVGLVILLVVAFFIVGTIFMYISSRMRFVLFDSVLMRECHIRRGWARRGREGWRLFIWQVILSTISVAVLLVVIGIPALCAWRLSWFTDPREHMLPLMLGGLALLFVVLLLLLVMGVIHVMTKDFVVPQMALEDIDAIEGWRRLWPQLGHEVGGYAGYIGMKIVLSIAAAFIFGIIGIIAILVMMIPIGGLGLAAVLGGKAMGLTWTVGTITVAVLAGAIAVALLIFLAALINVPATVFFPAYSMYFFGPRYPPLGRLLWPESPASPPMAS